MGTAAVQAAELRCDVCDTDTEAAAYARQAGGIGLHYVYSLSAGTVFRYQVEREPNELGTYDWFVFQESVQQDVANVVSDLHGIYASSGGQMKSFFTVYQNGNLPLNSAHDVMQPGADRTALLNWFASSGVYDRTNVLPLAGATYHSMAAEALSILSSNPVETQVTVVFDDGSKVTLSYDLFNNTATVMDGTGLDALGNPIPPTINDAVGISFDFSGEGTSDDNFHLMRGWLERLGAQMSGTGTTLIACVTANGTTTCTRT